jgi:NAD(P)-dependent dehydrogenase (short-subunit alcohol dehydrogenase family)
MSMETRPLAGRVALVTGASSGLGARFATVLADAGAQVVAGARRLERLEELASDQPSIHPVRCDVTDDDDRAGLVASALERFGRVDVCVNNAGASSGGPERQATLDGFRSVMRLNVDAVFAMSQAVAAPMRAQGSGSVINISSMFGLVASAPVPDAGYVASKSAVNGLTRELAAQWARDGVRVNAIAPGFFPSEMTAELLDDERSRRWFERNCPMGRPGRVDELDGVLLFLASDASSYCTGQVITVDGGWTIR